MAKAVGTEHTILRKFSAGACMPLFLIQLSLFFVIGFTGMVQADTSDEELALEILKDELLLPSDAVFYLPNSIEAIQDGGETSTIHKMVTWLEENGFIDTFVVGDEIKFTLLDGQYEVLIPQSDVLYNLIGVKIVIGSWEFNVKNVEALSGHVVRVKGNIELLRNSGFIDELFGASVELGSMVVNRLNLKPSEQSLFWEIDLINETVNGPGIGSFSNIRYGN